MRKLFLTAVIGLLSTLVFGQTWTGTNKHVTSGDMRYGYDSELSINNTGNVQQPFYRSPLDNQWYQLTFSNYPLDYELASGGSGTSNWNRNGTIVQNPTMTNQVFDNSGFIPTSANSGYGTIKVKGNLQIGSDLFEVTFSYYVAAVNDNFCKITTSIKNIGSATATNVRYWIGTRDDYVGLNDGNTKTKGNIVNGVWVDNTTIAQGSKALKISNGTEQVLFFTTSPLANMTHATCCSFTNATNLNPATVPISEYNDGSYAMFIRLPDMGVGQTQTFEWYYAAGADSEIAQVISQVASSNINVTNVGTTSANLNAFSSTSATGKYITVPAGSTPPTAAEILAGTNYGSVTVSASGSGALGSGVTTSLPMTGLKPLTNYTTYFVSQYMNNSVLTTSSISTEDFTTLFVCGLIDQRNNGNGGSTSCPGVSGTPINPSVIGTPYATVPTTAKTGSIRFKWAASDVPTIFPAITTVWINGVSSGAQVGPPSVISTQGGFTLVEYCFYTVNLPNTGNYSLKFVNPTNGDQVGICSYLADNTGASTTTPVLSTNTAPTITTPSNVSLACSSSVPSPVTFTVGDAQTTLSNLIVSATSSNAALLPNANITVTQPSASGAASIAYSIVSGQSGTSNVTLTVTDEQGLTATSVFTITVTGSGSTLVISNNLCTPNQINWATMTSITSTTATGVSQSGITISVTQSGGGMETESPGMYNSYIFPAQYNVPTTGSIIRNVNAGNFTACFSQAVTDPYFAFASIGNSGLGVPVITSAPYQMIWTNPGSITQNTATQFTGTEGFAVVKIPGSHTCVSFNYTQSEYYSTIAFGFGDQDCTAPTLCSGGSVTLTATGSTNYVWTPSTGLSATTGASVVASPTVATTYQVTNPNDACAQPASILVNVNPLPVLSSVSNKVVCRTTGISAQSVTSSILGTTFAWTNSNTAIGLAASGTGSVPAFTATNNTSAPITATITITGTSPTGCQSQVTYTITVNPTPTVNQPTNQTLCAGASTTATTFTGSTTGATYTWTNSNTAIGLAASGTGNIPVFTATNATNATISSTVTVTPSYGATGSLYGEVSQNGTLNLAAPTGTVFTGVTFASYGNPTGSLGNYTLGSCNAANSTSVVSGLAIGNTSVSIQATDALFAATACSGSNSLAVVLTYGPSCTGTPQTFTYTVNPGPIVSTTEVATICSGTSFTVTPANGGGNTIPGNVSYSWSAPSVTGITGTAASTGASSISGTLSNTTNSPINVVYNVTPTSGACQGVPFPVTVTVNPTPVLSSTLTPNPICSPDIFTYTATSPTVASVGSTTFTWSRQSNIGIHETPTSGTGNISGDLLTNITNNPVTVSYQYTISSNGCNTNSTVNVVVNPMPYQGFAYNPGSWSGAGPGLQPSFGNTELGAQVFIHNNNKPINSISAVYNSYGATGTFPITVQVRTVDNSEIPTGTILATSTITPNFNGGMMNHTWNLSSPLNLVSGTKYALVFSMTSGSFGLSGPASSGDSYPYGKIYSSYDNGSSWVQGPSDRDVLFSMTYIDSICSGDNHNYTFVSPTTGAAASWSRPIVTGISEAAATGSGNISEVLTNTTSSAIIVPYTYSITANGCSRTEIVNVGVKPVPALSSTLTPASICSGNTFTYIPTSNTVANSGAVTFTWSRAMIAGISQAAASGANGISEVLTNASNAPITVTYIYTIAANGCSATNNVTVVVNPTPSLANASLSACSGTLINFTPTNGNGDIVPVGTTYNWSVTDNSYVLGELAQNVYQTSFNQTLLNNYVTPQTVNYSVSPLSGTCTGSNFTISVSVNPLPAVAAITGATNVCVGLSTQLASATTGGTWSSSNASVASVSSTGVVSGLTAGNVTITYTVTNANGCTNTAVASVNVNAETTATITAGGATTFCQGGSVVLTANAGSTYLWSNGASTQSITASASGSYYVTVSNAAGCSATSTAAVVTQIPNPVVDIYGVTDICVGQTELFSSNIQGGTWSLPISQPIVDQSNTQYMNQAGSTSQYQTFTAGISGNLNSIAVNHANPQGNTAVSTVTVNVYSGAGTSGTLLGSNTITLPAQWGSNWNVYTYNGISLIQGQEYTFEVITPNVVFSWLNVDVNNQYSGGAYGPSISGWDMIFETNVSPSSYGTINQSGQFTATSAGNTSVLYALTQNGCTTNAIYPLTVNATPTALITAGGATTFCAGGSVILTANTGSTYLWSNGASTQSITASASGSYYVTVTNASGCSATSTTTDVTVNQLPTVAAITGATNVCVGSTTQLASATTSGTWSSSNSAVASVSSTGVVTGLTAGNVTITYTVTNANGCTNTATATVNVNAGTTASITAGGATIFCQGGNVVLTANAGSTYLWSSGAQTQSITVTASGSYYVTVTNISGCSATSTPTNVTVNSSPIATVVSNGPTSFCPGGSVTLTAGTATSYLWSNNATTQSISVTTSGTYTVTLTNASGCSATSLPVAVTLFATPTATITAGGATTFCQGGNVTLNANVGTGLSYQWSNSTNNQSLTVSTAGSYTVTVTDANGCSITSAATTVTVNPLPTTTAIFGSTALCVGTTTILGTTSVNPTWSSSNTAVATVSSTGIVTGVSVGTAEITYSITNANGCSNTASATVTVSPLPSATIAAIGNTTFCQGGSVTLLAANAPSGSTFVYQWRLNGIAIVGATANTYVATTSGNYSVTITANNLCQATSANTTVTVNPLPVLAANTGATSVCQGSTTTLANTTATGLWTSSDNTIATINPGNGLVTGENAGTVTLTYTFTNANGCTSAVSTNFTVNSLPTAGITANGATTFCQGSNVTLTASTGTSYSWSNGATTASIVASTSGNYVVTVTNANGCSSVSTPMTVTVNPLPVASITANGPTTFCQGGSVTLVASTGVAYLWSTNNAFTQSNTITTSGIYNVTITNSDGCSATSAPVTVTVNALPTPTITASSATTFCQGGNVTLTASAGTAYLWSSGETTQSIIANVDGPYSVTVTNASGCTATSANTNLVVYPLPTVAAITGTNAVCEGSTVVLATTTTGGTWSSSNTLAATISSTGVVTGVAAGNAVLTYTVTDGNACTNAVTAAMTVNAGTTATISASGATTFCAGGNVTLTASPGSTYEWSNGDLNQSITVSASGAYYVLVTNASGCSSTSATTQVVVNPLPVVSAITGSTNVCLGSSTQLTDATTGGVWSSSNANIATIDATGLVTTLAAGTTTITYTVTNTNGCTASVSETVTVNALPTAVISANGATTFCQGSSVTLVASAGTNYLWNNGQFTQSITVDTAGTYFATITNAAGCTSNSNAITVNVNALPAAVVTANGPTTFCQGNNVLLTATGGSSYLWSTGETTQSILVSTSENIHVDVTNASGCTSAAANTIVTVLPVTTATITANGPTAICLGSNVTLSATSGTGLTYLWSNGVTTATTQNITVSNAGVYTVTVTNASGCSSTATQTVIVNANPAVTVTANGPTLFCQGGSVTLTATGAASYQWNTGDFTSSITVNAAGSYFVVGTSAAGCETTSATTVVTTSTIPAVAAITGANNVCEGGTINLTSSTINGTWTSANNFIATVSNTGIVIGLNAGTTTISYTVTNGACSNTVTAVVNVLNNPVVPIITPSGATTMCPGGTVILFASNAANYAWSNGPSTPFITVNQSGNYAVTVTNASGCSASSLPINVFIGDNTNPVIVPPANITMAPNFGCDAIGVNLGAPNATDNCAVATVSHDAPAIFPLGLTTVTWTVVDGSGNTSTATQLVNIVDNILPIINVNDITVIINDNGSTTITFEDVNTGTTDNCGIASMTLSQYTFGCADIGDNTITVTVTDNNGNVATTTILVTVVTSGTDTDNDGMLNACDMDDDGDGINDANEVVGDTDGDGIPNSLDPDDDGDGILTSIEGTEDIDGDGVSNYLDVDSDGDELSDDFEWDFGGLGESGQDCDNDGVYDFIDTDLCGPVIPEAFTPNGNGFNDNFVIPGIEGYKTRQVTIFSRYGTKVYESTEYNNDWDGTLLNSGTQVPDGTYYYIFTFDNGLVVNGYVYINRVQK